MIFANFGHVEFDAPEHRLLSEFTTAGQAIAKRLLRKYTPEMVKDLFNTAFEKIQEDIENGGE